MLIIPDGLISIEEHESGGANKGSERNALTFTRQLETSNGDNPMYIPINAATFVRFEGDLFLQYNKVERRLCVNY